MTHHDNGPAAHSETRSWFDENFYEEMRENQFYSSILLYIVQGVIQLSVSIYFTWATRHIKDVSLWLKFMSWMPNLSWICYIPMWQCWRDNEIDGWLPATLIFFSKLSLTINFGYLIAMVRVQVQLRARTESTKKILEAIRRSK